MSNEQSVKLYLDAFWISPYSFSAFVALTEKRVAFDVIELALQKAEHRQEKLASTLLTGRIPAIAHGAFTLSESSAIVEYLDETFPAPTHQALLPSGREDRARARMLMAWVRSDLMPIREERATSTMFYERAKAPLSDAAAEAADRLLRVADTLIPDGSSYLFADAWTIADADLAFMLQRLIMSGHRTSAKIGNFVERQWARPSVRAFADHKRPPFERY